MPRKQKHKNQLALARKKKAFGQKQIATLLGQKRTNLISCYEQGSKVPGLKTALKLGIIYNLPLRTLFSGYYKSCLNEIKKLQESLNIKENKFISLGGDVKKKTEFCSFQERMKSRKWTEADLNEVRDHITELVQFRGERMDHVTPRK